MKTFKKLMAAMLACMTIFSLAACGGNEEPQNDNQENQPQQQEPAGKLIFGTSADYAPYEYHAMIDGTDTIVGADVKLAEKIAQDMGVELEIKDISFDVLLNELQNGTIDFVIAAMAADESRLQQADASDPYHGKDYQRVVFKTEDAGKFTSFDAFEGASVAVQSGAIQVGLAEDNLTGCELLILQSVPDMFNNLINGKCDAVLVDGSVAEGYIAANEGLSMLDQDFPDTEGSCVWVQKGDPKGLLEGINASIAEVLDGTYEQWLAEAEEASAE